MKRIHSEFSANDLFYFAEKPKPAKTKPTPKCFCFPSIKIEKDSPTFSLSQLYLLRNHTIGGSIIFYIFKLFLLNSLFEYTPGSPLPTHRILVFLPLPETAPAKFANHLQYSVGHWYFIRF